MQVSQFATEGDIRLKANEALTLNAAQLRAEQDIYLESKTVNINVVDEAYRSHDSHYSQTLGIGIDMVYNSKENKMWHIYKDDHSDLNFALECLYCDAISLQEFKEWIELVILSMDIDDIPYYIYDLLDFDEPLFHIPKIIGFDVINQLSSNDIYSIYGIAYLRGNNIYESPINREEAILILKDNFSVANNFKKFFPFIEIKFSDKNYLG
ncbi:MAG: hypothetical protein Q4D86_00245 [Pasteurella oralis]|nr:hypothetical protein [Pasteurella oralis]MDO5053726.1 hypothetical protein [Pasteurella oralis]